MNLNNKHMVSSKSLRLKIMTYSLEIVGKNESKHISCILYKGNMSLLNLTLVCILCRIWVILTLSLALLGFWNPFSSHRIITYCHHDLWSYVDSNLVEFQSHVTDNFNISPICKFKPLMPCLNFSTTILNHSCQLWIILFFVSMMWQTLWSSFDESLPFDSSSLSRKMI